MSPAQTTMPYAGSGGKGGSMGGFGLDTQGTGLADYSGGKGGSGGGSTSPTVSQPQTMPAPNMTPPDATMASQAPNAFDQGVAAMDGSMDWMQNAMGYQAPTLGGNYNVSGIDGQSYLNGLSSGRAAQAQAAMMSAPSRDLYDYEAAQAQGQSYNAAQLADKDLNDYMNPYTQSVIDTTMADLDKARQTALNSTGAAATAGGAFGGDRHAIMEAQNNADYMDQVARSSAQLRNQAYQNAQSAAMGDVNSLNQSYASNAGMAQQAGLSNQAAENARNQFVGGTASQNALQTAMSNQQAQNQMAALNAQLSTQASLANAASRNSMLGQIMGYDNANQQFNAGMDFSRDQFNAGQDQQQFANQMSAAQNMYGMGNDRFQMGQEATQNLANVGNQVDQINQGMINQIQQMFMNQQNAPQAQYQQMLAAMSGMPNFGGTQSYNPGVYDAIGLATGLGGAFMGGK